MGCRANVVRAIIRSLAAIPVRGVKNRGRAIVISEGMRSVLPPNPGINGGANGTTTGTAGMNETKASIPLCSTSDVVG